ncbi:MAG TPA: hypothetical protein VFF90_03285 [Saprospiraceae bacterium]|nr:hypothetical protein [Saprospiraceae bacterium]
MKNIFVFGCLLISVVCYGQTPTSTIDSISEDSAILLKNDYQDLFRQNFDFATMGMPTTNYSLIPAPIQLSNPFMSGMFCKMEYKLESKSKLSPRFRLGSQNYTDWMEGKKEIYQRYWK